MKKSIVLIGDIISSKKIPDRQKVQEKIRGVLAKLNKENMHLISPYTITLGDEFQAVLKNARHLFGDIITILYVIFPTKIRFSIGIGDIQTPVNPNQAIGMDGTAFYNARTGIDKLKECGCLVTIVNPEDACQKLIEQSLFLVSNKIVKWKQVRLQIFLDLCKNLPVKQMAKKMSITDKAIYKNIDDGELKIIKQLFFEIESSINRKL